MNTDAILNPLDLPQGPSYYTSCSDVKVPYNGNAGLLWYGLSLLTTVCLYGSNVCGTVATSRGAFWRFWLVGELVSWTSGSVAECFEKAQNDYEMVITDDIVESVFIVGCDNSRMLLRYRSDNSWSNYRVGDCAWNYVQAGRLDDTYTGYSTKRM